MSMGKTIDLTGRIFGKLTVIKRSNTKTSNGEITWECLCECGEKRIIPGSRLQAKRTTHCGCSRKDKDDLIGRRFGKLVVIKENRSNKSRYPVWLCLCDCGKICTINGNSLKSGITKSCGCFRVIKATKHGKSYTSEYNIWTLMKRRCNNPKISDYKNYGGRGIKVCERWLYSFDSFYADMGPRPGKECSIDRINNDGNYEPGNCRWATSKEQASNKRNSKKNK